MQDESQHVARLEQRIQDLERRLAGRGIRKQSAATVFGVPWLAIAFGPDPVNGATRGHARGILAIGDTAFGVIAIGGFARGVVAMGGLALGVVSFGGLSLALLLAVGGLAISGGAASGGGSVGTVAVGGGAVGWYACGGGAVGRYVLSPTRRDPEAIELFSRVGIGRTLATSPSP